MGSYVTDFVHFVSNHWMLWSLLAVIMVLLAFVEFRSRRHGPVRLDTTMATQLMNKENALVLDIRDLNAFNKGHILGAQSLLFSQLDTQITRFDKHKDKPVLLVCEQGHQSVLAGTKLKKQGFMRVYSLSGGMGAWRNAGLPLEKK